MVTNQQQLLELAKQGDPQAIAQLIRLGLASHGVQATVTRHKHQLSVRLTAAQLPAANVYGQVIYKGIQRLAIPSIQLLSVAGQQPGQPNLDWQQSFSLQSTQPPSTLPKPSGVKQPNLLLLPIALASFFLGVVVGAFWVLQGNSNFAISAQLIDDQRALPISTQPLLPEPATPAAPEPLITPSPAPSAPLPSPTPEPPPQPAPRSLTIKAVGDMILGTNYPNNRLPPDQGRTLFRQVIPYLKGADILFGNYESTFTNQSTSAKTLIPGRPIFAFRSPPAHAARLKEAGFHVLSVANNHSFDFQEQGFNDTMRAIAANGMQAVGKKGQILYRQVQEKRVAFIAFSYFSYHNSVNDLATAKKLVRQAETRADIVVVSHHSGSEGSDAVRTRNQTEIFLNENRGNQLAFSRAVVDAGADLVLGHGPHVPRAMELYRGKLIAYSLGNFVGYRTLSTVGNLGKSLILSVELDPQGNFLTGNIIPIQLNGKGIPYYDLRFRSVQLIRQLTKLDFPRTSLLINRKGQLSKVSAR